MAFEQQKLDKIFNQSRGIFDVYIYKTTTDNKAAVKGAGYFSESRFADFDPDWVGSKIEVQASDGYMEGFVDVNGTFTASLES